MAINKGDFIEIDYTGRLEDSTVFDTTEESVAKKEKIHNPDARYGSVVICVGQNHVVAGLDKGIEGKDAGKEYKIEVSPEEGFGKKDAKLIQMIATNKFRKENINPMPGLQVNIDGMLGIIRNVSGGRTLVDFNHPLSGQRLFYAVKVKRVVADEKEKVKAMIDIRIGLRDFDVELKDGKALITTAKDLKIPAEMAKGLSEEISKLVPAVKSIEFAARKQEKGDKSNRPVQKGSEAR